MRRTGPECRIRDERGLCVNWRARAAGRGCARVCAALEIELLTLKGCRKDIRSVRDSVRARATRFQFSRSLRRFPSAQPDRGDTAPRAGCHSRRVSSPTAP